MYVPFKYKQIIFNKIKNNLYLSTLTFILLILDDDGSNAGPSIAERSRDVWQDQQHCV